MILSIRPIRAKVHAQGWITVNGVHYQDPALRSLFNSMVTVQGTRVTYMGRDVCVLDSVQERRAVA